MTRPRLSGVTLRTLAGLLLVVVGLPAIALIWLGSQLMVQDRSLAAQRELEHRQTDLQSATRGLEKLVAGALQRLPEGAARYIITGSGFVVQPADSVLWAPTVPRLPAAAEIPFANAERAEFQGDSARALAFISSIWGRETLWQCLPERCFAQLESTGGRARGPAEIGIHIAHPEYKTKARGVFQPLCC